MKIKICGVTSSGEAEDIARLGANYIGIVFAKTSKRCVSIEIAREIALCAYREGAEPVAVFANEPLEQIISFCTLCNIKMIQLHGVDSQKKYRALCRDYSIIYASCGNAPAKTLPSCAYLLFDGDAAGSGNPFSWDNFTPPLNHRWMLAGGLNPNNVSFAIHKLNPDGVDVSSGVEAPDGSGKDLTLVEAFIRKVRGIKS